MMGSMQCVCKHRFGIVEEEGVRTRAITRNGQRVLRGAHRAEGAGLHDLHRLAARLQISMQAVASPTLCKRIALWKLL